MNVKDITRLLKVTYETSPEHEQAERATVKVAQGYIPNFDQIDQLAARFSKDGKMPYAKAYEKARKEVAKAYLLSLED